MVLVFSLFGIISTHTGVIVNTESVVTGSWHTAPVTEDHAIANTRNVGVVMGGLLGGPFVGLGIGLIAGLHRLLLGGFTGLACALSTLVGGVVAGAISLRLRKKGISLVAPKVAMCCGMAIEALQMLLILIFARPFAQAWELVQLIAIPMIVMNGLGIFIFVSIIKSVLDEKERIGAVQTQNALSIADQTLPFFRQGLGFQSCVQAAKMILRSTQADAIAITDQRQVMAHVGAGSEHHSAAQPVITEVTKDVLKTGRISVVRSKEEIHCQEATCPLQGAIVLPLKVKGEIIGTLKLYFTDARRLSTIEQELAEGLAKLFSTQLELGEAERQSQLLREAELKALHAQVHPHFLFNALNTIRSFCRTDATQARKQLLHLATFLRSNLQTANQKLIPIAKELEHVEAFFSLEQARYPGRFTLEMERASDFKHCLIPPFTLQPLVENAVYHGLKGKKQGGWVRIRFETQEKWLLIQVSDNGVGVAPELLGVLGKKVIRSKTGTGTALQNIQERLSGLFGADGHLRITSGSGATHITLQLPRIEGKGGEQDDQSIYSRRRATGS